jgi:tRNA1Val (adenine37-N6)-methyltransferase
MPFRFRYFFVEDLDSTMRVGTDSMLLGAWSEPGNAEHILDIGTGCGVLALMMAQKSNARIDAIEIDYPSVQQASANFRNSPWATRLSIVHSSFQDLIGREPPAYNFIICNPPFFSNSLKPANLRKSVARHDSLLNLRELLSGTRRMLAPGGRFALVLPVIQFERILQMLTETNLSVSKMTSVRSCPLSPFSRVLLELSNFPVNKLTRSEITILNPDGTFSDEYLDLTRDFHCF